MRAVATIDKTEDTTPRFSEQQFASERTQQRAGVNQPTYTALRDHMRKYGPDGILDSAVHLDESQYDKLVAETKKMTYNKKARKWETVR